MAGSTHPPDITTLLSSAAWLRRLAAHLVGGQDGAEDAVQETWVAALRSGPPRPEASRAWLRQVLANAIRRRGRSDARRRGREASVAPTETHVAPQAEALETLHLQRRLTELVAALGEPYRTTIVMRYFEGKTSVDIGQALGVPEGTVRWRIKEALERLRRDLDDRSGGGRNSWCLSLMPLIGRGTSADAAVGIGGAARAGRISAAKPVIGAVAALGAVGFGLALWQGCPGGGEGSRSEAAGGVATQGTDTDRPTAGRPSLRSSSPASAAPVDCIERLRVLAAEVARNDRELRRISRPDRVFQGGMPNDAARAEFAPALERLLGTVAEPPSHSLECRTYACRLKLTEPEGGPSRDRWMMPLQRDAGFRAMIGRGPLFSGEGGKRRDPLSGSSLHESVVYWTLHEDGSPEPEPLVPASLSASGCRSRVASLEVQLRSLTAEIEQSRPLGVRFATGVADPAAEREVDRLVTRGLVEMGKPELRAKVSCRGGVCSIELAGDNPVESHDVLQRLMGRDELRIRFEGAMSIGGGHVMLPLRDPSSGQSLAVLLMLHHKFKASGTVEACRAKLGGSGPIGGSMWIGEYSRASQSAESFPNGIGFSFGAEVSATPDGVCVIDAFRNAAREARVPAHRSPARLPFWFVRP
jgi:RNA polymerase sigma factor (sigma-70 family)